MRVLITLTFLLTLVSCAQLDYNIPTARMDSPEATGGLGKVDIAMGVASGYDVNLAQAYDFIINDTFTDESVNGAEPLFSLKGNLGLMPRLDIGLQTFPDTTNLFKVKYQFIGGDRSVAGWKLSLQWEVGYGYDEDGTLNTDTKSYSTDLEASSMGAAINVGYRFNPSILLYLNTVFMEYEVDGVLKDGATVEYDGQQSPEVLTILPGVRFDFDSAYIQLESGISYLNTDYDRSNSEDITYGFTLGYML